MQKPPVQVMSFLEGMKEHVSLRGAMRANERTSFAHLYPTHRVSRNCRSRSRFSSYNVLSECDDVRRQRSLLSFFSLYRLRTSYLGRSVFSDTKGGGNKRGGGKLRARLSGDDERGCLIVLLVAPFGRRSRRKSGRMSRARGNEGVSFVRSASWA